MKLLGGGGSSNKPAQQSTGTSVDDIVEAALNTKIDANSFIQDYDDATLDKMMNSNK